MDKNELLKLNADSLKKKLKELGLQVKGNKSELQERLLKHLEGRSDEGNFDEQIEDEVSDGNESEAEHN